MEKINFKLSFPLTEGILKQKFDEEELKKSLDLVENWFKENEKALLDSIKEITGMDFEGEVIDIWLAKGNWPSISNPPILNVDKKKNEIFFDLTSIIIHRLFYFRDYYDLFLSDYEKGETLLEAMVYLVSKKVLERIMEKEEFGELVNGLKNDPFNKHVWDEEEKFEKNIDFKLPLSDLKREDLFR